MEYLQGKIDCLIALEQSSRSVDYKTLAPIENPKRSVLVVGNEITGVSEEWLKVSDHVCHIQMRGEKESLNVSTACGIALFRLLNV